MKILRMLPLCGVLFLAACGGGGSSGSSNTSATNSGTANADVGGIWTGTDSTGVQVEGLIDESGDLDFIDSDGTIYAGRVTASGNSVSGTLSGYAKLGTTFADGSTYGTGTLSGTIVSQSSVSGTVHFTTSDGSSTSSTLALTFQSAYNSAASLSLISGNWQDPTTGDVISVSSSGGVSWQDSATGCVGAGTVSVPNASTNVYSVAFSYAGCIGGYAELNGVQFSGLGTLQGSQLIVGASGGNYAFAWTLNADPAQTGTNTAGNTSSSGNVQTSSNTIFLSGTVSGLTSQIALLSNTVGNGDAYEVEVQPSATTFQFAETFITGETYDVTLPTQPAGETCTVSDGSGTFTSAANVTDVAISCVTSSPPGGGNTSSSTSSSGSSGTTISPFEGLWSGPTTNAATGYPGMIVDANGVFWCEDVGFYVGAYSGTLSSSPTAQVDAASPNQEAHGYDTMTLSSVAASGGVLTLEGTLIGNCPPLPGGGYCSFEFDETGVFPWTYQGTIETPTAPAPVASLAGDWTTTWGSDLTINADGSFVLTDNAGASYRNLDFQPSGCIYTGQITLLDPTQNIYSVTATVTAIPQWITNSNCSGTAQGVFTLLNGKLAGGLASPGAFAVFDTD